LLEELGLEPSVPLQRLQHDLLDGEQATVHTLTQYPLAPRPTGRLLAAS
jgi:hypothetical protein